MKKFILNFSLLLAAGTLINQSVYAGNKDRSGQAGAIQLLNNPWAASTGVFGLDGAQIKGLQAMKVNIGGLSRISKTELGISFNEILAGTDVKILNAGFAQRLGETSAFGVNIQSTNLGEINVVNYDNPDPDNAIGTVKPNIFNASIGFAKTFSDRINAGIGLTFISEGVNDAKAAAACFDVGIQYVTGKRDNFHLGITLRNVGTFMKFTGDGFNTQTDVDGEYVYEQTTSNRTQQFELPTNLNIALAYDFYLDENKLANENDQPKHRLTAMGSFISNSFLNDYLGLGFEYGFKETFMLRLAYRYENGIFNSEKAATYYTGLSLGATVQTKLGKNGPTMAFDYSYRPTRRPSNGCHAFGLRFMK